MCKFLEDTNIAGHPGEWLGEFYKNHDLFPDSILIRDFTGKVNVNDIIASWEYLFNNQLINDNIKGVINNLVNCELDMDMESFPTLIGYLKNHDRFKTLKLAVISNNPKFIIFPLLGETEEKGLNIKPFSTDKAATNWIMFG